VIKEVVESPARLTAKEKEAMVDSKLKDELLTLELLDGHIEFINDIYSILDKMVYSIKYRLEMEQYTNI
jgi:hypothetical protein